MARCAVLKASLQAVATEANLLARIKLIAPMSGGCSPRLDTSMRGEGSPRQRLLSAAAFFNSFEMSGHARDIRPPTMTASGLSPFMRLLMPTPR